MSAPSYVRKHWPALIALFGALVVMGINIYVANQVSVVLPMVDGWAVWNRVILFNAGAMSWEDYLFKPHGAHLHSIIYLLAWFDYRFSGADQALMRFFSLAAVVFFASAVSWLIWTWGRFNQRSQWLRIAAVLATAALLTSVIDNETLIQPFQAVLSVSRLFYFALLSAIVVSLVRQKTLLYVGAIAVSVVAVTFHGSGYIFAGLIIVAHLLLTRRPVALIAALLPMVSVLTFQKLFTDGGGELSQLDKVFTPGAVLEFIQSASAYFAMPFRALRGVLGDLGLVALGSVMMTITAILTLFALIQILGEGRGLAIHWKKRTSAIQNSPIKTEALVIVFLTGLFLLLSAAASGVFWIIRTSGSGHLPAYMEVFVSTRYTAYSTLGLVMVLGYVLTLKRSAVAIPTALLCGAFLILALWPAAHINRIYLADDQLNRAAAALSIGISPIHPEAEVVWPQAATDWYWSKNLPKTVAQLRLDQKSIWKELPPLGSTVDSVVSRLPLSLTKIRHLDDGRDPDRCGIEGTLPTRQGQSDAGIVLPLVTAQKEIIGYVSMMRHLYGPEGRRIEGFLRCGSDIENVGPLFLASTPFAWHVSHKSLEKDIPAFNVTDPTWLKGIARGWSGFFVKVPPYDKGKYKPGNILRFADGQLRVVLRTSKTGTYLNVFLDGGPLDGNVVGYPEAIELID
jgi:hypothetical protein